MKRSTIAVATYIVVAIAVIIVGVYYNNNTVKEEKKWCCDECKALHDEIEAQFGIMKYYEE